MIDSGVADLLIEAGWKSVAVAGLMLLALALLKRRSAAERACVAHVGMAAVLLLPLAIVAGPSLELLPGAELQPAAVLAEPVADRAAPTPVAPGLAAPGLAVPGLAVPEEAVASEPSGPWIKPDAGVILYAIPAALLMLMTLAAVLRLFALRRRANVIVQQAWLTAMAHAQRRMGIKSGTALLVSKELSSPVSWGLLRPIILLSEDALEKPVDAEAIIAHELAHVARLDWLNLLIARVATAMFWFNPLVWLLARQGHQLREEAADDAVLRAEIPNTEYAALLVGAARHEGKSMLLAANGVAPGKGSLSQRVRRILEPTCPRRPARFAWGAGCAAGAVLVAGPLAALTAHQPRPPAPMLAEAPPAPANPPSFPANAAPPAPSAAPAPAPAPAPTALAAAIAGAVAPAAPAPAPAPAPSPAATGSAAPPAPAAPPPPRTPIGPSDLVSLAAHGITPEVHAEYVAAYPRLRSMTADQLVSLRVHGMTARRLREYTELGYGNVDCNRLIEWAVHGVSPGYIRSLAGEGYKRLSPAQLIEFRVMGVTSGFIRKAKQRGLAGLTPDRLVNLRVRGFDPDPEPHGRPHAVPRPRSAPHT